CEIFADANMGKFYFTLRRRRNISHFPQESISHFAARQNISLKANGLPFATICATPQKEIRWKAQIRVQSP
ncbi:MAG: hypothetical protein IIV17_02955, partial [Clostridia bacterium]|nr:hypothetical protein [Clostridia bacterium]